MPIRIQRKRARGWRAPVGAKYVGRGTRWGNPYAIAQTATGWAVNWAGSPTGSHSNRIGWSAQTADRNTAHDMAVGLYSEYLAQQSDLVDRARLELAGHDLMCWCAEDQPCHVDILLRVASIPNGAGVCKRCWHWESRPELHPRCPDCGRPWDRVLPAEAA